MTIPFPRTAMVLAAGFGERMRPLTFTQPKPMVEIMGRKLIDRVLDRLVASSVSTAVVNLHYMSEMLEMHLAGRSMPNIIFSDEREAILGTGGGVQRALPLLGESPFFLLNSDVMWTENGDRSALESLVYHWDEERMDMLLLLSRPESVLGYDGGGDFVIDDKGRLRKRVAGSFFAPVYMGAAIVHPRVFKELDEGACFPLNAVFDHAMKSERLFGHLHQGVYFHIGTPEALDIVTRYLQDMGE